MGNEKKIFTAICPICLSLVHVNGVTKYKYKYYGEFMCSRNCFEKYKAKVRKLKLLGVNVNDEERNKD